jgi:hypothetical protein
MATGCYTPSPAIIPGPMSATLADAVVADPTSVAVAFATATVAGARSAWSEPEIETEAALGVEAPEHDGQWFERIHVLPSTANLGYLLNNREVDVEVWNACRRGLELASTPVSGPDGVSILSEALQPIDLPQHFSPLQSRLYTALVSVVGEDLIDNVVTWVFAGETFLGACLRIVGWRMMIFSCKPNGQLDESIGYLTDVLRAWDGSEQRVGLRETPDRTLSFKSTMVSQRDVQNVVSRLLVTGRFSVSVPLWPDAIELLAPVSVGDYEIYTDAGGRDFHDGGLCILWKDSETWETFLIATVEADHIHLSAPATAAWPILGTLCIPVVRSRSLRDLKVERASGEVAETSVAFNVEPT